MYYSYAELGGRDFGLFRLSSFGLANLLFPWARFIVATKKYDLTPICPTWLQIKVGSILGGQSDKRFYNNLFYTPQEQISGMKKLYLLNNLERISEAEFKSNAHIQDDSRDAVVVFGGVQPWKGFFSEVLRDHALVFEELLKITRDRHKKGLNYDFKGSISIHVRLGDFFAPDKERTMKSALNYRIPISWYVQQVEQIRKHVERNAPVYVFSDGKDVELAELLALPNTRRIGFGASIADMLGMANSTVLIGSGSTFSMWASYLGRMPVIWHKGQRKQKLYYEDQSLEVECDESGHLTTEFLDKLAVRLGKE